MVATEEQRSPFHWQHGISFQRRANGAVALRLSDEKWWLIPAAEWCSIVAEMSAHGGTAESYSAIQVLHGAE